MQKPCWFIFESTKIILFDLIFHLYLIHTSYIGQIFKRFMSLSLILNHPWVTFHFSICVSGGAACSPLQIELPQGSVGGGGSERGRVSGKCASLPGKLHRHRRRHLRVVRRWERRAGLRGLTSQNAAGLRAASNVVLTGLFLEFSVPCGIIT